MQVLITGAGGQMGKEWEYFCTNSGIVFHAFDSKALDVTKREELERITEETSPDVIINCAAYTKVDQAEDEEGRAEEINSIAVATLARICADKNIKLVHYSTDYVFSGSESDRDKYPEGYDEEAPASPQNAYGRTKYNGEMAIVESGCEYLILRVSWLCGLHGNNFVKTMLRLAQEREELSVVNDQLGCPAFTKDVVAQTKALLEVGEFGVFHLGSKGIISWYDFAKEIFALKQIDIIVNPVSSDSFPTKAKRPSFSKLSTKKISTIPSVKILGWKESLRELISEIDR
ncbi:MAG: dTDP-4-dehydrorhamnose reductase [Balneolaceae bacterium]